MKNLKNTPVNLQGSEEKPSRKLERQLLEEMGERAVDLRKRFWMRVKIGLENECWEWTGNRESRNYGRIKVNGVVLKAHRASVIIKTNQMIPEGLMVCHSCDNPPCVNPNHLWIGTNLDNQIDAMNKGRKKTARGEKARGAKLTEKKVLEIREILKTGICQRRIAEKYGMAYSAITYIKQRKTWNHI